MWHWMLTSWWGTGMLCGCVATISGFVGWVGGLYQEAHLTGRWIGRDTVRIGRTSMRVNLKKVRSGNGVIVARVKGSVEPHEMTALTEGFRALCELNEISQPLLLVEDGASVEELDEQQLACYGWVRSRPPRPLIDVRESLEKLATTPRPSK